MSIAQYLQIGRCMKVLRTESGILQKEMAVRLELSAATYSNYENEYSVPPVEIVQQFCGYIGISINDFFRYAVDRVSKERG